MTPFSTKRCPQRWKEDTQKFEKDTGAGEHKSNIGNAEKQDVFQGYAIYSEI